MTNLNFCNEMTGSVDKVRAVDKVYLEFRDVFDTVSKKILINKLLMYANDADTKVR